MKTIVELQQKLDQANKELKEYIDGHKGACSTCERVGELNVEYSKQLKEAEEVIGYLNGRFNSRDYGYIDNMGKFHVKGFENVTGEYLEKYNK